MTGDDGQVELISFFDAIAAHDACRHLETAEVPFTVEDFGVPSQGIDRMTDAPPIHLRISVAERDLKKCQELLRRTMRLFPEAEKDERGATSDEPRVQVAACDERQDAECVREALRSANIASTLREITDDDEPGWLSYSVEVRYEDIERAFRTIERWSNESDE